MWIGCHNAKKVGGSHNADAIADALNYMIWLKSGKLCLVVLRDNTTFTKKQTVYERAVLSVTWDFISSAVLLISDFEFEVYVLWEIWPAVTALSFPNKHIFC